MGRRVVSILMIVGGLLAGVGVWVTARARNEGPGTPAPASVAEGTTTSRRPQFPPEEQREALFAELQPVKITNCTLARFGERNDGGYLACSNLLADVRSAYSYGISGYDGWGCDVSTQLKVPVHEYDCFDTRRPFCPTGQPVFHPECIAGSRSTDAKGRVFDSMQNQIARNGDADKHLVVKMDVEGAEWDSILKTPDEVLARIDQMIFEFHGVDGNIARSLEVVLKLKKFFYVANFHINNYSCSPGLAPFGGWAYEVTFVSKRLAKLDPSGEKVALPNPLDTRNHPGAPDCQVPPGPLR